MKLKKELTTIQIRDLTEKSNITEIAFYIGTIPNLDNIIKDKLISKVTDYDGALLFFMFVEYLANKFVECNETDIYEFVDYQLEDLLDKFIIDNCEEF